MSTFNWEKFLQKWSRTALESSVRYELTQDVIQSGWLGYKGATEAQIVQAERRLGVRLPASYRAFIKVTNGWRQTTPFIHKMWPIEEIDWFANRHSSWIHEFTHSYNNLRRERTHEINESNGFVDIAYVPDSEYFTYGEKQDCSKIRLKYLHTALEISDRGDSSIYLLNPKIISNNGEWEAWFFGDWLPGADRFRSFQEMMEVEYMNFLEMS